MDNSYRKVGNYKISNMCLESYPCKHSVCFKNGNTEIISGDVIYRWLKAEGLSDEHLDQYAKYVRKIHFPTLEEIKERKYKMKIEEAKKEYIEREKEREQQIVDQYKASSRIEKLKQKLINK